MRGFHAYFKFWPTARAYVARPLRWGITGATSGCRSTALVLVGLLLVAGVLAAQVDAVLQLHGRDAAMTIANTTQKPLRVALTLYRDSTLTDSLRVRITPQTFVLAPGQSQTVRLRLREAVRAGAGLRLATLFTPVAEAATPQPTMRVILATRIVTRVEAGP